MENKEYYTPTVEELFIGYECEIAGRNAKKEDGWINHTITNIPTRLICRTPYLCKQDIVDLGWKVGYESPEFYEIFGEDAFGAYKVANKKDYILKYSAKTHSLSIRFYAQDETWITVFNGKCKSKNELKKLMKDYLNIPI